MKKLKIPAPGLILIMATMFLAGTTLAGPIMIANNGVPSDTVAPAQVQKIFLGKSAQWNDGARIILATLKGGDTANAFLKTFVKKSPKQFSNFWKKAVFSGTGEMPASFKTEAELVTFVAGNPGAVGFIDEATAHESVKVIAIK